MWSSLLLSSATSVANLVFSTLLPPQSGRRPLHRWLSSPILVILVLCWWGSARHQLVRRDWFQGSGVVKYQRMVDKILADRLLLNHPARPLHEILHAPHTIYGRTNEDGSVFIWFTGRDNNPRTGYLYYSGPQLTNDPVNPNNPYFFALTNGWYEY